MRGLFFKVFIIFWIAQSLIFVISTGLIVRRHFDGPEAQFDMLDSILRNDATGAAAAWENGGCAAVQAYGVTIAQTITLADASGQALCRPAGMEGLDANQDMPIRISGSQVGLKYVWRVPVTSESGKRYVFLLSRPHVPRKQNLAQDLRFFAFPQLPVAIVVGGLTTFVLVLLVTRPVVRLRKAARELALGRLNARGCGQNRKRAFLPGTRLTR